MAPPAGVATGEAGWHRRRDGCLCDCPWQRGHCSSERLSGWQPSSLPTAPSLRARLPQFGGQEPGDAAQVESFVKHTYGPGLSLMAKVDVNGPSQHPVFAWLKAHSPPAPGAGGRERRGRDSRHGCVQPCSGSQRRWVRGACLARPTVLGVPRAGGCTAPAAGASSPLYPPAAASRPGRQQGADISWNFEKFLVDQQGRAIKRYNSGGWGRRLSTRLPPCRCWPGAQCADRLALLELLPPCWCWRRHPAA